MLKFIYFLIFIFIDLYKKLVGFIFLGGSTSIYVMNNYCLNSVIHFGLGCLDLYWSVVLFWLNSFVLVELTNLYNNNNSIWELMFSLGLYVNSGVSWVVLLILSSGFVVLFDFNAFFYKEFYIFYINPFCCSLIIFFENLTFMESDIIVLFSFVVTEGFENMLFCSFQWMDNFITLDLLLSLLFLLVLGLVMIISYYGVLYLIPGLGQFILEFLFNVALHDIISNYLYINLWGYFPVLFFIVYFLLFWNVFGLFPYGHPPTFYLTVTLFISLCVWMVTVIGGFSAQNFLFFNIVVSDVALVLVPVIMLLEIFSYIMRVISLAVSLSANIIAGHTILAVVSSFFINMFDIGFDLVFFCLVTLLIVIGFELFVCGLQAYIFVVLSCLYLNDIVSIH